MPISNILYDSEIKINDKIRVAIPTVGEILDNEEHYYSLLSVLTAMPIDFMVRLDEMGIDFSKITSFELFLELFPWVQKTDTSLFFRDLDLSRFQYGINEQNGKPVLVDPVDDIVIDRNIHAMIASALRNIHGRKKDNRKPANDEARDYMLETAKRRLKRRRGKKQKSQLETLIVAMVNTHQYKYNFESTRDLTIYQFTESVKQVMKKVDYENRMYGVYTGSIRVKDMSQDDLNWLIH